MGQIVSSVFLSSLSAVAGLLLLVAATVSAWAVDPGVYEYAVMRDGERIGYNRVVAAPSGDGSAPE